MASAAEALDALDVFDPDVLVSDIEMPDQDGYELIRQVGAFEEKRGTQIGAAALTAHARAEDRLRALVAGFDSHVVKPVDLIELVAVIASLTRRGRRSKNPT